MTLRASRALRNMVLICGTICTGSFCTALNTAKNNAFKKLNYSDKPVFKGEIKSLANLEDFAKSKNCTFLFYDEGTSTVKEGRGYLAQQGKEKDETKIVEEAKKQKENCTENSFVFTKIAKVAT